MSDSSFSAVMTSLGFTFIEFPIETSYPVPASSSSHLSVIGNLSSVSYAQKTKQKVYFHQKATPAWLILP